MTSAWPAPGPGGRSPCRRIPGCLHNMMFLYISKSILCFQVSLHVHNLIIVEGNNTLAALTRSRGCRRHHHRVNRGNCAAGHHWHLLHEHLLHGHLLHGHLHGNALGSHHHHRHAVVWHGRGGLSRHLQKQGMQQMLSISKVKTFLGFPDVRNRSEVPMHHHRTPRPQKSSPDTTSPKITICFPATFIGHP